MPDEKTPGEKMPDENKTDQNKTEENKTDGDGPGFTVHDRRGASEETSSSREPRDATALPNIDFSTLVLSFSTSALMHLGETPDPDALDPRSSKSLPMAKQTIDILEMLEAKTQGNLTDEESKLLAQMLYDLRLRYVAAAK